MKQLVYISGPYTNGDVDTNVNNAIKVADELVDAGYMVFIPHLNHFWHMVSPKPYEFWIELDLYILPICSALLRLPGKSDGADNEVRMAKMYGIPVFHSTETLIKLLPKFG